MKKIILELLILTLIIPIGGNFAAKATTLSYTPVTPCKIVDTRNTSAGMIGASTERDFHVFGDAATISAQGGNSSGCPAPLGEPLAAHINMVAVNPTGKGNIKVFPVGGSPGANLGVNFSADSTTSDECDNPAECLPWTNFANAGIVKTNTGSGPDITVAANYSSADVTIQVLGYYYPVGDLSYTPVSPCKIVDTRNTSAGMISASTQHNFHVYGLGSTISAQGGNSAGCPAPLGEPLAAHINMVAVNPTGKGNMKVFPVGGSPGANLSVNFADIGTNFANAGTVKTSTGSGPDITVAANYSSAHVTITVLGHYYHKNNFAPVQVTGQTERYAPGDDGDLQMGVQWPDPRFTDNGDGTVTDHLTGLIWVKNTVGCVMEVDWYQALDGCNNLADGQCGLTDGSNPGDWRLPNIRELQSLLDWGHGDPAMTPFNPFFSGDNQYWSSTTDAEWLNAAIVMEINHGGTKSLGKSDPWSCSGWPVRGGN